MASLHLLMMKGELPMKHIHWIFCVFVGVGLVTSGAFALTLNFQQNEDNGSSEYEWEANNWYDGSNYVTPTSADNCTMAVAGVIDGQTAECLSLVVSSAGGGAELTIKSGTLEQFGAGYLYVGKFG